MATVVGVMSLCRAVLVQRIEEVASTSSAALVLQEQAVLSV